MPGNYFAIVSDSENSKRVVLLVNSFFHLCRSQNEKNLAETVIKIHLLNSKWWHVLKDDLSKKNKQLFFETCIKFLRDGNVSSSTIQMQHHFYKNYVTRDIFKEHQKQVLLKSCHSSFQKLKKVWHNATEDFREMHDDLVKLILIKEGMQDADDSTAFDDMKIAVNNVFPVTAMSTFVLSSQKAKMSFINEISAISAGLRLEAWHNKKAGNALFDVGKIMREILPKICEDLQEEICNVSKKLKTLEELLLEIKDSENAEVHQQKSLFNNLSIYKSFLKILKEDIDDIAVEMYKLDYSYTLQMNNLNSTVKTGPFPKTDKYFPAYKELSKMWKCMRTEAHRLNLLVHLYQEIKKYRKRVDSMKPNLSLSVPKDLIDEQIHEDQDVQVLMSIDVKNYNEVSLEHKNYCTYHCSKGIMLPKCPAVGIAMFDGKYYGFSSTDALKCFTQQPVKILADLQNQMFTFPELIIALQKEAEFHLPTLNNIKHDIILPIFVAHNAAQTVTHPVEKHIDYTYNWNQWSMRKQAINYVNMMDKKTHSTQTYESCFRRENHSQAYPPRDQSTQTNKDASTITD